ncbi:MAG: tyrosine-type recombinase/integrase [Caldilineaceae bacterium]
MQRKTYTLGDALELFLLDCTARRLTKSTQQFYKAKLAVFIAWCKSAKVETINGLESSHLRKFSAHIAERGLSSQYQHNLMRAIRAFLNYAVRDDLIKSSPFSGKILMPVLAREVKPALSKDEIKAILQSCDSLRDEAAITFFLDCGLRASELIALNVGNIDTKTGTVVIPIGKGQKGRTIFIGTKTRKVLIKYFIERNRPKANEPAFTSERGNNRLTLSGIVQLMRRISARSGVKFTAHQLRRTFALEALRSGMSIYHLQKLMGHADIVVLRRYLALVDDDVREAHQQHGLIDNLGR